MLPMPIVKLSQDHKEKIRKRREEQNKNKSVGVATIAPVSISRDERPWSSRKDEKLG